jgi:hypothetical protein
VLKKNFSGNIKKMHKLMIIAGKMMNKEKNCSLKEKNKLNLNNLSKIEI